LSFFRHWTLKCKWVDTSGGKDLNGEDTLFNEFFYTFLFTLNNLLKSYI